MSGPIMTARAGGRGDVGAARGVGLVSPALGILAAVALAVPGWAGEFRIEQRGDRLAISDGSEPIAEYVYGDEKILRPYFANIRVAGGIGVTRNHPPVPGKDAEDHADMHPGIWMGFGNVSGNDFWRNKGRIVHERFVLEPTAEADRVSITTVSTMQGERGEKLAKMLNAILLSRLPGGWRLDWKTRITPQVDGFFFGDQEEMGLGVRVATPIAEKNGGLITNSEHRTTAGGTWGRRAAWCDYSGLIEGRRVGVLLVPDPANPHPSWWHNRDYGVFVANPFGREAMKQGKESRIEVKKGQAYPFNHSIYLYAIDAGGKPSWERYLR